MKDRKNRLRRTMMFVSAQRPSLMKDAYIYGADSIIFDLEDAVAENQKDAARFSLYHILRRVDYGGTERIVRINGLDTPHWREDVRVCVAGGADGIRIAKCETPDDVTAVEQAIEEAEAEFGAPKGSTLLMAALESPRGIINSLGICESSGRLFGVAISGGDLRRCLQTKYYSSGSEMQSARGNMLMAGRAAGVQCFDTVFTDLDDMEGFVKETTLIKEMGFDGKSVINPRQIKIVHDIFSPTEREIREAERVVRAIKDKAAEGVGVFTLDGKMLDVAFLSGAERTLELAKASGLYREVQ